MINIDELIKESLKSGNKTELKTYRNLKAEFQKVKTAKNAPEWNDALEMQIISKYSRILEDAILQFSEAHRDDLVSEYTSELEVVKKLLPEPVNESQIHSYLLSMEFQKEMFPENSEKLKKLEKLGIIGTILEIPKKEMGIVIKHLKSKFPTADGKMISEIVKKYLI